MRLYPANQNPVAATGDYVLYWMTAYRRPLFNFALEHAVAWAKKLNKPLLVCEPLWLGYQFACDRFHLFAMQGMHDNAQYFANQGITYYPYVEPQLGDLKGLLPSLSEHACLVVGDFHPGAADLRMHRQAGELLQCRLELVDSSGFLPLQQASQAYPTAYAMRRFLQQNISAQLADFPQREPVANQGNVLRHAVIPKNVAQRFVPTSLEVLANPQKFIQTLPICHTVASTNMRGGYTTAQAICRDFLIERLPNYATARQHPDVAAASYLSPYLRYGHISTHEILQELIVHEHWDKSALSLRINGAKLGFWGMSVAAETFLDELITWRELALNTSCQIKDYQQYSSLPKWAQDTLSLHEHDPRPHLYSIQELEAAATYEPIWNAAQHELLTQGTLHNYLRMLWGKLVLTWSKKPIEALHILVELNNKYALDGRDSNSYAGIFWIFGRYDRPWPERAVFGTVRSMTAASTRKKLQLDNYLAKHR